MALSAFKGTVALNTSGATQAVTGVGFQPKVVIFWGSYQTTTGYSTGHMGWFGAASSATQQYGLSWISNDAEVTMATGRTTYPAYCGTMLTPVASDYANDGNFHLASLDAGGFTIAWDNNPGSAVVSHFLALGGTDVTNAKVASVIPSAGTGSKAFTGVGFRPDVVILFTADTVANNAEYRNSVSIGFATDSTHEAVLTTRDKDNTANAECTCSQRTDRCLAPIDISTDVYVYEAEMTSMDADGFTLNVTAGDSGGTKPVGYIAIKGGQHFVGSDTQKTSTGTKATTGVGFTPKGAFFQSWGRAASATIDAAEDYKRSHFAAVSGAEGGVWFSSDDAAATSATDMRHVTDKALAMSTQPTTTNAEADLSTLDAGGFTLDWTTADATAREFIFWTFGDTAVPAAIIPTVNQAAYVPSGSPGGGEWPGRA